MPLSGSRGPLLPQLIDGELVSAASGRTLPVVEPASGAAYADVAAGGAEDVARAVAAAERAFPAWSATPAAERSRLLLRIAELIDASLEELAAAESRDTGKPLALARRVDIPRAAANFRFFATAILHTKTEAHETDRAALNVTLRRPRGVAGLISPWNLPLYLLTWKIAPALATGNTAVAKPSELTPATASMLAELSLEAGLPPGVLNIVHGTGAEVGVPLVEHAATTTLSFTGSTKTGADIAARAAPAFKKLALEMGGKNPTLVFADADFEHALSESLRAAFSNQGQICLCGSRIYVERPLYARFVDAFVERTRALVVGDPLDAATNQGALVSADQRARVLGYLDDAIAAGARALTGGGAVAPEALPERCRGGYFVAPSVLVDVPASCRLASEEVFGPVVTIAPFDDEDEALRLANGTRYGLAAALFTRDLTRAQRVASALEAGTVWVNTWMLRDLRVPFGGTKDSGVGREGGEEALRFFTEPKNVCWAY